MRSERDSNAFRANLGADHSSRAVDARIGPHPRAHVSVTVAVSLSRSRIRRARSNELIDVKVHKIRIKIVCCHYNERMHCELCGGDGNESNRRASNARRRTIINRRRREGGRRRMTAADPHRENVRKRTEFMQSIVRRICTLADDQVNKSAARRVFRVFFASTLNAPQPLLCVMSCARIRAERATAKCRSSTTTRVGRRQIDPDRPSKYS